jgi:hypothetical protein
MIPNSLQKNYFQTKTGFSCMRVIFREVNPFSFIPTYKLVIQEENSFKIELGNTDKEKSLRYSFQHVGEIEIFFLFSIQSQVHRSCNAIE